MFSVTFLCFHGFPCNKFTYDIVGINQEFIYCLLTFFKFCYVDTQDFTFPRCDIQENLKSNGCKVKVTIDTISTSLNVAQVYPKLMSMSLLPGEEREVAMEIFEPEKGPLDLYILMDFSNSMEDDLDNLKRMGAELADLVGTLSNDYTIGFGKFVDKVTEPQTDMRPSKLKQPWPNSDPPFSFQNTIPLTSNISLFRVKLEKERISGNLDAPEGGFDAILQAAVCQRQIGWRKDATHLLVFSTESAFHYEADGTNVLAGILPRNDEQCHLTEDGSYTHDTLQDYPSVPTLVRLLGKHNIIPIFAVTNHSYSYYEKLHSYFPIADIGELQEDSSNILSIMKTHKKVGEQQVCSLSEAERKGMMRVKPTTFSAYLGVETEVLCATCECEKVRLEKRSSRWGKEIGKLGPFCNCSAALSNSDYQGCKTPDSQAVCSNHGDCLCGTCICHNPQQYEGPYCQYDKTQCARFSGFLCNDRGRCYMGSCACEAGWEGSACECPKSNQTCLDSKGGICNGRGTCQCGRCVCDNSNIALSPTCEIGFQAQLGMCEDRRTCVQCQAWKTGELKGEKCKDCPFKITMVDELKDMKSLIILVCCHSYSVCLHASVCCVPDCPPGGFLWLIPLIMFLMLLLGLLLLCCWKYCACCKVSCLSNHALSAGRMVGFKEDQYMLRHSTLTSDYLDTPLVRTGPPKSTDVVRWKITDNVHRNLKHYPKFLSSHFPVSLRLNRLFTDSLSRPDARDTELLRREVEDNVSGPNAGKRQNHTVVDTVLSAPRAAYPDIVNLTEKSVQSGNFGNLKVVPGYYTVATDRGAVEMQEGVESVDVRVPLFVKDEDDDKKQLRVEATDVPLGIAEIGRRFVNITIIKDHAKSVLTFLQPSYVYSRQDKVAKIPVSREIIEDGHTQVSYRTRDLTAKDQKDYISVDGDLSYQPGETQKVVPVKLLELGEADSLLSDKQVKQFVMDLSNPRQGAKLGRYPRTTVTIMEFTQSSQSPGGRLFSPSNIKPTATGPKSIHLNWDAPHGNPQGYKVKYWIQGDPETDAQVVDCKTTHTELTNLYPYCDYEMRVCGYNTLGDGVSSDVVHCQTLEDVPSEPGRLAFNVISPTVTQLSWAEPAETNGIITAYEVIYTPIDEDNQPTGPSKKVKIDNPKKRMLLIENLQPSQTYRYNVRACNSVGWGPYRDATINLASQPSRPMSIPIIPDIPIVDAEAGEGYDSFLMYSSDVLRSPGGRPSVSDEGLRWKHVQLVGEDLDLRKVSWRLPAEIIPQRLSSDTEASDEPPRPGRAQTPLQGEDRTDRRMTALPATTPTAKAKALQKPLLSLTSSPFQTSTTTIETTTTYLPVDTQITTAMILTLPVLWYLDPRFTPGVPDTPSRLVFSALGPTALKVSWQEPHCEREVLGYCVLYQLLNGGEMKRIDVPGNAENSVVVQDLLPNHSYIFKVKAQSQEGWGPEREGVITIESAVDPRSPLSPMPGSPFTLSTPSAPGPLVFTALSPDALQLSWDKPRKPNGDIVGYMVTCEQLHGGGDVRSFQVSGDGAETSLTVSDLAENVPYKFKVQARTTQGFGPEREGIITIESQDGGTSTQSMTRRDVFHLPGEMSTRTNVTHTTFNDPYFKDGMMVTTQHMETGGSITRHVTKEVVTRSVMSGTSGVTKKVEKFFEA
uniref:Integrin beta n=1 Tax=Scleropages formosus TaxID=113540 RepID=A0A8C9SWV3_SCLFO